MPERYSYSKLSLADSCLRSFFERYEKNLEDKLPETFAEMRETGKAVHACADRYKEELHANGVEQDLSIVSLIVEEVMSNDREISTTRIYDDVFFIFRQFANKYRHNPATYMGGEYRLERALPETDIVIEGYPDHIERMQDEKGPIIVSTDLKTGFGTSVTDHYKFQGEIMAWMMLEWFQGARVGWRVDYPRTDFVSEIEEFEPIFSPRLEGRMRSIIARVHRAREEKKWPATPGSGCEYCPIAAKCRERNVLVKEQILVTNADEALGAAADLVIIEAAKKQRVEQLKEWAREHGPISVGDVVVGHHTSVSENMRIGDVGLMILRLGILECVARGYAKNDDDPYFSTELGIEMATYLGTQIAIKESLIVVNGNRTKAKGIQEDKRLEGLWIPGEPSTKFGIQKPKPPTKAKAAK